MMTRRLAIAIAVFIAALMLDIGRAVATVFTPIDDPLAGQQGTEAQGISGNIVVGQYIDPSGNGHGFIYNGSTYTTFEPISAKGSIATGVDGDKIVGSYQDTSNTNHGYLYDGSTFTILNDPGASRITPTGISGNTIVGVSGVSGFIYDGSTYRYVSYPGATQTQFNGISGNNIVGEYYSHSSVYSFVYDGTSFTPIADPLGPDATYALGISGNKIVGVYRDSITNYEHGFLYDGSTYRTIDNPLGPTVLNGIDGNTVVGGADGHSFIVTPLGNWIGANSTAWADSGNWGGTIPGATTGTTNSDTATFDQTAPNSPLTIDAGRNISGIAFDTANVNSLTVGATSGQALLLTAHGTIQTTPTVVNAQSINAPLVLEGDYTFTSGASSNSATLSFGGEITPATTNGVTTLTLNGTNTGLNTISGDLGDNGAGQLAVTMSGTGVWILSGANTFTGGLTINSGLLSLGSGGALNSSTPNAVAFGSGSTGTLALAGNSVTVSGLTTSAIAGSPIVENAGGTATALTVNNAGSNTFAGVIQDGGGSPLSVNKTGSGILTLTGFNTFTGGLTVSGGIVKLDAPGNFAVAAACPVMVGSGAELDLNQTDNIHDSPLTVNGVVNITGGGHQHINLLSLNGATIKTSGSSFANDGQGNYALDSSTTNVGGTSHSTLAASVGIQLNASPTFNVASTGDPAGDLIVSASLRNQEGNLTAGFTKAGLGKMLLTANSTYTGQTTIIAGTLSTTATGSISSGPLVVSAADTVTSKLNLGANQTVGSLSGTLAGDGSASVNVASGVTLTVDQATDTTYAGAIALAAGVVAGRGGALIKSSGGTLEVQSGSSFANNSFLEVSGGKLRFNVASGSASVGTGAVALVSNGAILELAGSVSALSSGKGRVDIINISTAPAGLVVAGTHQQVGGIDGSATTQVNAGSDLTANHIIQNALLIGGTGGSRGVVTIDASDSSGNPLDQSSGFALAGSLTPSGPFGADGISSANLSSIGNGTNLVAPWPDSPVVGGNLLTPVPEPSSALLLGLGGLAVGGLALPKRWSVDRRIQRP